MPPWRRPSSLTWPRYHPATQGGGPVCLPWAWGVSGGWAGETRRFWQVWRSVCPKIGLGRERIALAGGLPGVTGTDAADPTQRVCARRRRRCSRRRRRRRCSRRRRPCCRGCQMQRHHTASSRVWVCGSGPMDLRAPPASKRCGCHCRTYGLLRSVIFFNTACRDRPGGTVISCPLPAAPGAPARGGHRHNFFEASGTATAVPQATNVLKRQP